MKKPPPLKPPRKTPAKSVLLPDTFTVRDLGRKSALVLKASLQHGKVRIRPRSGPSFSVTPEPEHLEDKSARMNFAERMQRHHARMKEMGWVEPSPAALERIHQIIAGEV